MHNFYVNIFTINHQFQHQLQVSCSFKDFYSFVFFLTFWNFTILKVSTQTVSAMVWRSFYPVTIPSLVYSCTLPSPKTLFPYIILKQWLGILSNYLLTALKPAPPSIAILKRLSSSFAWVIPVDSKLVFRLPLSSILPYYSRGIFIKHIWSCQFPVKIYKIYIQKWMYCFHHVGHSEKPTICNQEELQTTKKNVFIFPCTNNKQFIYKQNFTGWFICRGMEKTRNH